jgi:glycosyltransferase involved in cell wall biosynthesis
VLVGSRHTAESLWAAMDDPDLPARTRLGPPGVDVERFAPREPDAARAGLEALRERLAAAPAAGAPVDGTTFDRDPRAAAAALAEIAPADRPVIFVGKLIGSKGIELLLAAWPLVLAREPAARLVIVGFGTFRPGLERLAAVLGAGDLEAAAATRAEDGRPLEHLSAFLAGLDGTSSSPPGVPGGGPRGERAAAYRAAAAGLAERVSWVGRLEHDELADLLPACEAMAVPSTFPEAFGMVAAEAAACAALPVVANHSGLGEVARTLAAAVPPPARPWLAFDLGPDAVAHLAGALSGWLGADARLRAGTRAAMVTATRERYSWQGVGRTVIAAARGELAGLPSP